MARRNILWIMCDQLRFDYLGCAGHPHIRTPNIDRLAARGVRFSNTYVQSPICGPSRMSFYTGRYVRSHGANWMGVPMRVGAPTLGGALAEIGVRNVLVGKTHVDADVEGMQRLGIDPQSPIGRREAEGGFEVFERDDGLVPKANPEKPTRYNAWLRDKGYDGDNPWHDWANSGVDEDGNLQSGWLLDHADKPARIDEPDSETPYMTRRAMEFIRGARNDERPWCLHLSYIKPHWPYIVPPPYHDMYGPDDVIPVVRSKGEREDPHPLFREYMDERVSRAFSDEQLRRHVIPAYMGLITQIDDQIGVLLDFLDGEGISDETMIVFTSDHGDYLGDHWLGEKELFHDASAKVPLIVCDPDSRADSTRGTVRDELVEAIDLAPTFVEYFGGTPQPNVMEGRSLMGFVEGTPPETWRTHAFSEYDYAMRGPRGRLDMPVCDCNATMVTDGRFKYVHVRNLPDMLFDLQSDPGELVDLGRDPAYVAERRHMRDALLDWALRQHNRTTRTDQEIAREAELDGPAKNIFIGFRNEEEMDAALRTVSTD